LTFIIALTTVLRTTVLHCDVDIKCESFNVLCRIQARDE